jgi:formate hydrogenlyase subunit 3/multisubunit Na+/H+ antiporter MnhD subunit
MAFAILGEAFLLLAFAMLAAGEPHGSLRIPDVVAALPGSAWRDAAMALLIAGFGAKMGLVPLNGWMPLAYAATPIPAAAVLSGAGVKAGVIGLIRFLPLGMPLAGWGEALAVLGFATAFYGVLVGVTQENPKAVLAYSSASQMGVIAAALGIGLAAGDGNAPTLVAFYAANHVLVKGALFLTVGASAARGVRPGVWSLLALALALSLAGLPFTGGALAKAASKPLFGYGVAASLAALDAAFRLPPAAVVAIRGDAEPGGARPLLAGRRGRRARPALSHLPVRRRFQRSAVAAEALGRPLARAHRRRPCDGARAGRRPPAPHSDRRHHRAYRGGIRPIARRRR